MAEATLEVPTSYFDRVLAIADAHRTWPLIEVLEQLTRDTEMEPVEALYDLDQFTRFVSLLKPWAAESVVLATKAVSLQRGERLPLWSQSDYCINIYVMAAEDAPAWTLLMVADRIVKAIEMLVRAREPEFSIEFVDIVAGSGAFRARCSSIIDNAVAGVIGTLIAGFLISAGSDDQQKDEIIALQRDIMRLDRSRDIAGFSIYREQGEYGRVDDEAIASVPKIDHYLHENDILNPNGPLDFITMGTVETGERGTLVEVERTPGTKYVLFDDRKGGGDLPEGRRVQLRGFFATNSRNKEVVFVLREVLNTKRRFSRD